MFDTFSVWNPLTPWSKIDCQKSVPMMIAHCTVYLNVHVTKSKDHALSCAVFDDSERFVFVFNPGKIQRVCKNSHTYALLNICLPFLCRLMIYLCKSIKLIFLIIFLKIRGFSFVSREDQIALITTCMWVQKKVWIFPRRGISESTWHLSLLWQWIYP